MLLILDIDGTIADYTHRFKDFENKVITDYADLMNIMTPEKVGKDTPIPEAQEFFSKRDPRLDDLYIITGRNEYLREVTLDWLVKHFNFKIPPGHLIMRPSYEQSYATDHKERSIKSITKINCTCNHGTFNTHGSHSTILCIDDDPHVLHMYSKYGMALKAPECWKLLLHYKPEDKENIFGK